MYGFYYRDTIKIFIFQKSHLSWKFVSVCRSVTEETWSHSNQIIFSLQIDDLRIWCFDALALWNHDVWESHSLVTISYFYDFHSLMQLISKTETKRGLKDVLGVNLTPLWWIRYEIFKIPSRVVTSFVWCCKRRKFWSRITSNVTSSRIPKYDHMF